MLKICLTAAATLLLAAASAHAADTSPKDAPDLSKPRALIKAKDYQGALAELMPLTGKLQHADLYNLIGFASRKSGEMTQAATFYAKALDLDPNHLSALEYQGEMFIQLGQLAKAKANLARLVKLCPTGCEEREDLEKAVAKAAKAPRQAK